MIIGKGFDFRKIFEYSQPVITLNFPAKRCATKDLSQRNRIDSIIACFLPVLGEEQKNGGAYIRFLNFLIVDGLLEFRTHERFSLLGCIADVLFIKVCQ